mgnify:CR=1 FL=1
MKKTLAFLLLLAIIIMPANAMEKENVKPVKNVILLIPDGTSLATISIARWLQWYQDPSKPKLNIDPYLCGTVRTHSSNAPIGDSAPTTSCYMTGQPSRTGYVSTYPENDGDNDIYRPTRPVPSTAYTVLEAGKMLQGKATGWFSLANSRTLPRRTAPLIATIVVNTTGSLRRWFIMISMSLSVVEFLSLQRIWKIIYWRTDTMFIKMT